MKQYVGERVPDHTAGELAESETETSNDPPGGATHTSYESREGELLYSGSSKQLYQTCQRVQEKISMLKEVCSNLRKTYKVRFSNIMFSLKQIS